MPDDCTNPRVTKIIEQYNLAEDIEQPDAILNSASCIFKIAFDLKFTKRPEVAQSLIKLKDTDSVYNYWGKFLRNILIGTIDTADYDKIKTILDYYRSQLVLFRMYIPSMIFNDLINRNIDIVERILGEYFDVFDFKSEKSLLEYLIVQGPLHMRKYVLDMIERSKYNIAAEVINKLIGELDVETVTRIAQMAHIDFRSYKAEVDYQWVDNTDTHPAKVIMMFEFLDKPFYLTRGGFFMIGAMRLKNLFEYLLINRLDELKQIKWYLIAEVFSWGDSPKSIEVLKSIFDNLGPFDATEARGYLPHLERNNTTKLMKLLGDYLH